MLKQCKECGGALTYGKYCSTKGCPNEGNNDMSKMSNLNVETREFEGECEKTMHCIVCECDLTIPGGYDQTGLCGPCCTGEAETLEERGVTW